METQNYERYSEQWFNDRLEPDAGQVPEKIRGFVEDVCRRFNIGGMCDPMYIANVCATELQVGDGRGSFHADVDRPEQEVIEKIAHRIAVSYSTCLREAGGTEDDVKQIALERLADVVKRKLSR